MQPGYRGTPDDPGGDTGGDMSKGWYAGCQYDGDIAAAKKVLENLDKYYPEAKEYEVAGFFWWQGDKDMRNAAHYESYEKNFNQKVRNMFGDRLMGSYETHFIPGQFDQEITLFMISVRRSGSAVYFIDEKYSKKHQMHKKKEYFYIRVGDSAHEVLQDERIKLINSFQ